MNRKEKVYSNRDLNDYEIEMISLVFQQNDLDKYLDESYIYIVLEDNGDIDIMHYPDDMVKKTCVDFVVTPKQAIEYLYSKDLIDQEVAELLYWADIDNYKKYVPVVKYENNGEKEVKQYADYYFFAKNEIDAADFMSRNAYFDYIYLEDVDAQ